MKKIFPAMLIALCMLLTPVTVAYADVVYEPQNEFYLFNASDCEPAEQDYYSANGAGGSVSIKEAPGSKEDVAVIENGAKLNVYCTYNHAGKNWGLVEFYDDGDGNELVSGWVPVDELLPVKSFNPSTGVSQEPQQRGLFPPALMLLPVAAVAAGMVILIRAFWKPKKD